MKMIFDIFKWIWEKRNDRNAIAFLVAIFFSILIGFGLCYYFFVYNNPNLNKKSNTASILDAQETWSPTLVEDNSIIQIQGKFPDLEKDWNAVGYFSPDSQGFYCVRQSSSFKSPDMWYKIPVPANFELIEIKYESNNISKQDNFLSTFIFSLGDNPRILRFYVAEENAQVVGFERKNLTNESDSNSLERDVPGKTLSAPIKEGTPIELKIKPRLAWDNSANVVFTLSYISSINGRTQEDSFSYDFQFPYPNPKDSAYMINFGIATIKGGCIKPISYKIYY